ncbi:MAG: NADH-quinone oxidoreductase subunit M [Campylobacteraceae bacterium]|jgi:NADH-quinone oxidoreductase subunit M|nr:NADH-quinone oxidoreductase subunit M [Campylobacteraceae bacterium]MBT3881885.1 NADH-quinone oxidoreductase subunit M [Campylobacteraceae bacterium]MBT4029888.1 NADH-quinone oxidoreductase subunit M [Campylobacteraceae bacterium]MBT4178954.1 NADH-quinone oxidoreductase subunit M [Campylobacteraceae bacterium]MBT4573047.1 NADH-quinone oxidoreductase subunit M [Campylobacteraceae bacterium]
MEHILSILIFFPAVAALMAFIVDKDSIRVYGITVAAIEFVLSAYMWYMFDGNNAGMQFTEFMPIIAQYGISYNVGIDGISLFLIIMTTFMTMISLIGLTEKRDLKNLIITVLFLEMTMVGVFVALDAMIFYVFWELSLVPMLYIVGAWGGNLRIYASIKFFLYTFLGSLVMLVGMLYLAYVYSQTTGAWSFNLMDWNMLILPFDMQMWLFIAFFAGFAIKVPMVPFHTWLPYAHGQAPTIGSVILAAVLLKMGTYGFIRFSLPLFPDASVAMMIPMGVLALIAIIYTAMVAYAQEDMKQVIAYSSVSHMGVIILGIFALNVEGIGGSLFLMISHGIVSGALFMLVGVIYDRRHTKMMSEFGGLAAVMPMYAVVFGIMLMASVGLPLTIGFVGEFLSLLGFFAVSPILTVAAGMTIILGAVYMLVLYKKTFFGPITNPINKKLEDIKGREVAALVPLVMLVVYLGVYPKPILDPVNNSVKQLVQVMHIKAITPEAKEKIASVNTIGEAK